MAIEFRCPHGHLLRVSEKHAGRTGRCPRCKALISIPHPPSDSDVSEDAILSMLGNPSPSRRHHDDGDDDSPDLHGDSTLPMKACSRCNSRIPVTTHICPHCQTYLADASSW
jgi:hypothetical protein